MTKFVKNQKCETCGLVYIRRYKSRFCSNQCRAEAQKIDSLKEIICAACKQKFTSPRKVETCSRQCAHKYRVQKILEANQAKCKEKTGKCKLCNNEFERISIDQIYCSLKCRKKKYTVLTGIKYANKCDECGAEPGEPCRDEDDNPTEKCACR